MIILMIMLLLMIMMLINDKPCLPSGCRPRRMVLRRASTVATCTLLSRSAEHVLHMGVSTLFV